jgi:Lrp/AsnC family transcriptional regulator
MQQYWDILPILKEDAMIDLKDRGILRELQHDAGQSIEVLSDKVHLSRNACWRRVKALEDEGVIRARVVLLDAKWLEKFAAAVKSFPEIVGVYRTTGDTDYLLQAVVSDIAGYDRLYKRLIAKIPLTDVSSSFVMEKIKETTALPLDSLG